MACLVKSGSASGAICGSIGGNLSGFWLHFLTWAGFFPGCRRADRLPSRSAGIQRAISGLVKIDVAQPGLTPPIDLPGQARAAIAQLQHGPGTTPQAALGAEAQCEEAALDLLLLPP